jgi:uncharacterized protein (TIGR03086 family)
MTADFVDHYRRASDWAISKVEGATNKLDQPSPCEQWDVRTLLNHMLDTQTYFLRSAKGEEASPPSPTPPALLGDDPVGQFKTTQSELIAEYSKPGVADANPMPVGIAFSDTLLHGCDVARATGQDDTMPEGLAEASYEMLHGNVTDENRKGAFGPEIEVGADASAQEKLLGFTGRAPTV